MLAKAGPRKKRERKIYSRRVESVDRVVDVQPQILACVKWSGFAHEHLGQILPQPPVALFVGIGQRRFGHRFGKAQMVKRAKARIETFGNVPQPLPPRQLRKCHADELLATTKMSNPRFRVVTFDQAVEGLAMHEIENLREDVAAGIHAALCQTGLQNSNASHQLCRASCSLYSSSKTSSLS